MSAHDAWLNEGDPANDDPPDADEVRAEMHGLCPVCKADMCLAADRECPCEGEGAEPLTTVDGESVCSEACLSTWEAGE